MIELVLFYGISTVAIFSALAVVFLSKPTRALLSLIVMMASLSVLYILLGAFFISMINLIIYAGAVLVLFLFVIMLQGIGAEDMALSHRFAPGHLFLSLLAGIPFLILLFVLVHQYPFPYMAGISGAVEPIGKALFTKFLLPFELTSILLLLGVFAAVALAKQEKNT